MTPIRAVVFDVGETLIDETRSWAAWADWFGVPHLTFFGLLGVLIARGESHRNLVEYVRPGSNFDQERIAKIAAGRDFQPDASDLYPDAVPCLTQLRIAGYRLGIAGNQPQGIEAALAAMDLGVEMIGSSQRWGVEKPSPEFFARVADEMDVPAAEIAYVGDRLDNDVLPAIRAGMIGVFLWRGPWGYVHAAQPEVDQATLRLTSLLELPVELDRLNRSRKES